MAMDYNYTLYNSNTTNAYTTSAYTTSAGTINASSTILVGGSGVANYGNNGTTHIPPGAYIDNNYYGGNLSGDRVADLERTVSSLSLVVAQLRLQLEELRKGNYETDPLFEVRERVRNFKLVN